MSTKKLQVLDYKIKQAENADTIDGKHAVDFATATDMDAAQSSISDLQTKIGDTSVSDQIATGLANKVDKVDGKGLSTHDYTTDDKDKLSGIASGAEVNQNAFSNIVVDSTIIVADAKTDTLTLAAGTNIILTPDETNDKVTISLDRAIYAQNDEPSDAPEGAMWIDLDEEAAGVSTDADTVDGKHASDFASASDVADLQTLVGDTSVANQIQTAMASVPTIIYGTEDLTAGTSELATGAIYLVYEAV